MAPFALETWVLIGGVAMAVIISALHVLGTMHAEATKLHDLKARVNSLRIQYA